MAGCQKDDVDPHGLPRATQSGQNTAGFLENGQPWLPKQSTLLGSGPAVQARYGPSYRGPYELVVNMSRYQDRDHEQYLTLHLAGARRAGTYALEQEIDPGVITRVRPSHALYQVSRPGVDGKYYTGPTARGQVVITRLDTVARVVAGTFEATVKQDGGPDSLRLSQGRFDVKY
ncbi:hypothetical protein [Hymenobacter sp. B1770]|uniref:hypothetical protein n=1 Tax=Hymenobacter sp. B1770 TaxID=1718788 RepID=UPI003CF870A7